MAAARLSWLARVRAELARAGDPARARGQQAYMKTTMPYHGVAAPEIRAIYRRLFAGYPMKSAATWRRDVLAIWRGARFREERYVAIELLLDRRARSFLDHDALPVIEELVVSGAWWDLVDGVATHALPLLVEREPVAMRAAMLAWSEDADLWKRRAAILCQLPRREATDLELLYACVEPSLGRKEFWLRKAIGWALRQYARTDPAEVARYVRANAERLSPLSIREALKHVSASVTSSPARGAARKKTSSARRTRPRAPRARRRTGG